MDLQTAITNVQAFAEPAKIPEKAAYHKIDRPYWGVPNPALNDIAKTWRQTLTLDQRIETAGGLWQTNALEGRILAAKLLTQARIKPDDHAVWALITSWLPDFDSWAIADHVCVAGHRRVVADPTRLDEVETWTTSDHMWTRRAAMVITLPWTKQRNPKPEEIAARERILGWATTYVDDHDWFIQKSIGWWLRDLSKRDPGRVVAFLEEHGDAMKPFARKEAARQLPTT